MTLVSAHRNERWSNFENTLLAAFTPDTDLQIKTDKDFTTQSVAAVKVRI